jgi:Heavy metal associated domain 2
MHHGHIAHHVPGRLRLKIPSAKGDLGLLQQIEDAATRLPEVERVEIKPSTGSVVIEYRADQAGSFASRVLSASRETGLVSFGAADFAEGEVFAAAIEAEAEFLSDHSLTARGIIDFLSNLNQSVKRSTNSAVDLRLLLPLGLGVYSVLIAPKNSPSPLWVTLMIFSINSFINLHEPPAEIAPGVPLSGH